MTRTIFRNILLVGLSVLFLCMVLFFGLQYTALKNDTRTALEQESVYVLQGVQLSGREYLDRIQGDTRIDWISAEGESLYSSVPAEQSDIQPDSPEILSARENGEGQSIRRSEASGASYMYIARLLEDGSVIRLGQPMKTLGEILARVTPVLWILVIVLIISAVLAFRAASKIVRPINEIDLDHPDMDAYPEIRPLLDKIQEQTLTIQEEAAQREQMRREFSANVSHELKTPLTSISGFAELMSQGIVSPDKVQEFSSDIYKESQRLIALIDDIIALSKLDEEAVGPVQEKIDLYVLAQEVIQSLSYTAQQKKVRMELSGPHAYISGVYRLLYEMVFNLCDNAVKYNYPEGEVRVILEQKETSVNLTVADTGIGISPEHQKRVFERFYRVDKSHSREIGGTGLGLSIVKHGAQFHDAKIHLSSMPGEGTRITLEFPVLNN